MVNSCTKMIVVLLMILLNFNSSAQEVGIKDTHSLKVKSTIIGEEFRIDIFLPRGYPDKNNLPVIYVLDSEYNFGAVTYITRRLIKDNLIPDAILVGVSYDTTYQWYTNFRQRDYTPTKTILPYSGGGRQFLEFLEKELIPLIELNYKVSSERLITGHSLGGLIGFYSMILKPSLFSKYLLVSPSLWYDENFIFSKAENFEMMSNSHVYTAIGEYETIEFGQRNDMVNDLNQFIALLKSKEANQNNIFYEILDNETHRTVFPRAYSNGLRKLLGQ